jgi:hypothetical protein
MNNYDRQSYFEVWIVFSVLGKLQERQYWYASIYTILRCKIKK